MLASLCRGLKVKRPDALAVKLALLMEVAVVLACILARPEAAQDAKTAAAARIAAARK